MRSEEPCGRTVFRHIGKHLKFVEKAGRVATADRFSTDDALWETIKDLEAEATLAGGQTKRRARQPLVALLFALEKMVDDSEVPDYIRMWSFTKAMKLWMGLRADDLRGLPGDKLALHPGRGLSA